MDGDKKRHIIQKQIFDVEVSSEARGRKLHDDLSELFYRAILPLIERVFDEMDEPGQVIKIDRLEIDLGNIVDAVFEDDILFKMDTELRNQIREKLMTLPLAPVSPGAKEGRVLIQRSNQDFIFHFLQYGVLPINAPRDGFSLKTLVDSILERSKDEFFLRLGNLITRTPITLRRLATQMPQETLIKIMQEMQPNRADFIEDSLAQLEEELVAVLPEVRRVEIRTEIRMAFVRELLSGIRDTFNDQRFIANIREKLVERFTIPPQKIFANQPYEGPTLKEIADGKAGDSDFPQGVPATSVLEGLAGDVLSGALPIEKLLDLPEVQIARIWEYLFRTKGKEAVALLMGRLQPGASDSATSPKVRIWQYLMEFHTESLHDTLAKEEKTVSAVKALQKYIPPTAKLEVMEWLFPGQEAVVAEFIRQVGEAYFKTTTLTSSQITFLTKVQDAIIETFSKESTPKFKPKEAMQAILAAEPEVPNEVKEVAEEFEKDDWSRKYRPKEAFDLPEIEQEITEDDRIKAFLSHYFEYGVVPFWTTYSESQIENAINILIRRQPDGLRNMIADVFDKLDTPGKRRSVVTRIIRQLSESAIIEFIATLEPEMGGFLTSGALALEKFMKAPDAPSLPAGESGISTYKWKPALQYLVRKGNKKIDPNSYIRDFSLTVSAELGLSKKDYVDKITRIVSAEVEKGEMRLRPVMFMLQELKMELTTTSAVSPEETRRIEKIREEQEISIQEIREQAQFRREVQKLIQKRLANVRGEEYSEAKVLQTELEAIVAKLATFIEFQETTRKEIKKLLESAPEEERTPELIKEIQEAETRLQESVVEATRLLIRQEEILHEIQALYKELEENPNPVELAVLTPEEEKQKAQGEKEKAKEETQKKEAEKEQEEAEKAAAKISKEEAARREIDEAITRLFAQPDITQARETLTRIQARLETGEAPTPEEIRAIVRIHKEFEAPLGSQLAKIKALLPDAVRREIESIEFRERETTTEPVVPQDYQIVPTETMEIIDFFLKTGSIPTKFGEITQAQFEIMLREFIDEKPREARAFFMDRLASPAIRKVVVREFPADVQSAIVQLIKPSLHRNLMVFSEELFRIFNKPGAPIRAESVREHRLNYILISRQASLSPFIYLREAVAQMAKKQGKDYFAVMEWLQQNVYSGSGASNEIVETVIAIVDKEVDDLQDMSDKDRQKRKKQLEQEQQKTIELPTDEPIYITNAGLVILQKLLPFLFKNLAMLNEAGNFKSAEQQQRAVYLLHYLVFEESQSPSEYNMPLNKLLVGMDITDVLEEPPEFTDKEKAELNGLLKFCLSQWARMKDSKPGGLRGSFLIREGRLSYQEPKGDGDAHWILRVEQKPYDMIMSTFPYPYSKIQYEWMGKKLLVEWT